MSWKIIYSPTSCLSKTVWLHTDHCFLCNYNKQTSYKLQKKVAKKCQKVVGTNLLLYSQPSEVIWFHCVKNRLKFKLLLKKQNKNNNFKSRIISGKSVDSVYKISLNGSFMKLTDSVRIQLTSVAVILTWTPVGRLKCWLSQIMITSVCSSDYSIACLTQ